MHRGVGSWSLVRCANRRVCGGWVKGLFVHRALWGVEFGADVRLRRLHVVLLQNPPLRGEVSLSALPQLGGGACEIYCSAEYVLVLKGLKLLVADITDVAATEVLCVIHLDKHTVGYVILEYPVE